MNYYVGIDGGGTKTAFACYNEEKECVAECILESCHVLQVDREKAISILKQGLERLAQSLKNDVDVHFYICAGLAGYGKDKELRKRIESICEESFKNHKYVICNDGETALAGALNGKDGILVISGTGSIAYSTLQGHTERSGGWGYMLGDEGSAYWIGKKLLQEYTKQCDGRHSRTDLVEFVKNSLKLKDDYDLISYTANILKNDRGKIAKLALLVNDLAKKNDKAALRIYDEAAREIAEIIHSLSKSFPNKCYVSYIGGVWKAKELIIDPLKYYLNENIILEEPKYPPVFGAYLIAYNLFKV